MYDDICRHVRETALVISIQSLVDWDERTMMPSSAAAYRAEQATLLAGIVHRRWTDPALVEPLGQLAADLAAEDRSERAITIRRLQRAVGKKLKLPQALVEEQTRTAVLAQHAWQAARHDANFASFRPHLEKTFALKREEAAALGYEESPYDPLLDDYEPEERTHRIAAVLDELRQALVPLVAEIAACGRCAPSETLRRHYPQAQQELLGRAAAAAIGFDFSRGRLDVTAHPFCTGLGPDDCRITTRYDEQALGAALFGILHEAGHGLYEQGLPPAEYGLPLGQAVSLGIHESQSRMWENLVGRSHAFWRFLLPRAKALFPQALGDVAVDDFVFAVNEVRPSLIRVEADEATYNLHILVRFELEQALLADELRVADLPTAWNEKYRQYLGIVPPNDAVGVLQDVHWSAGLVGYFPTYALGNLYAAQFYAQAEAELGPLEASFAAGDFRPLLAWLREKIHCHGQRFTAAELVEKVTGRPLSSDALIAHLRRRLGPLYGL